MTPTSEHSLLIDGAASHFDDLTHFTPKSGHSWPLCSLKGLLTKAHCPRFRFSSQNPNRIFALTLFRIGLAYELGVQRYGVFSAEKR